MAIKTFTFCDICNSSCIQQIDRRQKPREGDPGRRHADACAWVAGEGEDIVEQGWIVTSKNKHICPKCYLHHKDAIFSL